MQQMDDTMLKHFCKSDPNIARLCRDDSITGNRFWQDRYERSFGEFKTATLSNWKDRYLDNIVPPGRFGYITSDIFNILSNDYNSYVFGAIIDSDDMDNPKPEGGPVHNIRRIWTDKKTFDFLVQQREEERMYFGSVIEPLLLNPARFGKYYDLIEMSGEPWGVIPVDPWVVGKVGGLIEIPGNVIDMEDRRDIDSDDDGEDIPHHLKSWLDLYGVGENIADYQEFNM
jgi:hypothetical protein